MLSKEQWKKKTEEHDRKRGSLLCGDLNKIEKYREVKSENRGRVDQVKAWERISQKGRKPC